MYSCGVGDQGQLGMGYAHLESLDTPTPIEGLVDHKVTCISCGTTHSGIVSGELCNSCMAAPLCLRHSKHTSSKRTFSVQDLSLV